MKLATFPNQVVNKSQKLKSYWESVNKDLIILIMVLKKV